MSQPDNLLHPAAAQPVHKWGGAGSHTYPAPQPNAATPASPGAITFNPSAGDMLDLSVVDASSVTGGIQAWTLEGNSQLGAHPGHLILTPGSDDDSTATGPFQLIGDRNGDGKPDYQITVTATGAQVTWVDVASHLIF